MAKATIQMPEEFLVKLSRMGARSDEIAEKALKAGGDVLLKRTKTTLKQVIGKKTKKKSRSTGELEASLGLTGVQIDRNGNSNIKLGFKEPRASGDSNAKLANIIEYGKVGQPAKPFLKPALRASKNEMTQVMIDTLSKEFNKI